MNIVTLTERQFELHVSNHNGICTECGEIRSGGCEPDAENYECYSCEAYKVCGIETALLMGLVGILE